MDALSWIASDPNVAVPAAGLVLLVLWQLWRARDRISAVVLWVAEEIAGGGSPPRSSPPPAGSPVGAPRGPRVRSGAGAEVPAGMPDEPDHVGPPWQREQPGRGNRAAGDEW